MGGGGEGKFWNFRGEVVGTEPTSFIEYNWFFEFRIGEQGLICRKRKDMEFKNKIKTFK